MDDFDATRATIGEGELVGTASAYLTSDVAMNLPFEALGPFKNLLRKFFSRESWTAEDEAELSELVALHIVEGWWEHDLGGGITLTHGIRDGRYLIEVAGATEAAPSIFDRVFDGPVVPEATPHPRKVKFVTGGTPAPGCWYLRSDSDAGDDSRVARLFQESDVTDVMVAGDFVTVGIGPRSSWESRLEPLLALVTELFDVVEGGSNSSFSRDELLDEAGRTRTARPEDLHLLDPDDPDERLRLEEALTADDPRTRRVAVAILLESEDEAVQTRAVHSGMADESRLVRRTTVDSAADSGREAFRELFEEALTDTDAWIRWKAVRSLGELGIEPSRIHLAQLAEDSDFQVRFEVARVLKQM